MTIKILRALFATAIFGVFASFSFAGPGLLYWRSLHDQQQFNELKAGDKIAFVCNQCKTVSEVTVASRAKAMELCQEGALVACPACKMQTKVVFKRQRGDAPTHTEVTYVNEKGEECLFIAKVADKN
jgi:hypothetical protein